MGNDVLLQLSFFSVMALRNLIPPKIASASAMGAAPTAKRMTTVVDFYSKLPKGAAPKQGSFNPISAYRQKYFEGDASGAPIVHLIGALFLLGYTIDYQRHLKHHKNNVH